MSAVAQLRGQVSRLVFGSATVPVFCNLGLDDPQELIEVSLSARGEPLDVTRSHVIASTNPLLTGIASSDCARLSISPSMQACLRFRNRANKRVLGELQLRSVDTLGPEGQPFRLFRIENAANYCLAKGVAWRRQLHLHYQQWRASRRESAAEIHMPPKALWALFVFYLCPRPVFLVSVSAGGENNMFPMDLVGSVGGDYFSLALHRTSKALPLIECAGKIALSSVPSDQISIAYQLGRNHNVTSIDWATLPFVLGPSPAFGLPTPCFALRVRDLQVESIHPLGSHTFFLCRVVSDQQKMRGLQFFQAHGSYEAWRNQALHPQSEVATARRRS